MIKPKTQEASSSSTSDLIFRLVSTILVSTVWISTMIFGLYIIAFYFSALFDGGMDRWNTVLPKLYEQNHQVATSSIGIHFIGGGIILILGCIQLLENVRIKYPVFHRWTGRIYVLAALFTAVGGLSFIVLKGTVGGTVMDIGFGLYGILTFVAAIETIRHARANRLVQHRAWALRLFALAVGSWLYRMDYGFWFILMDGMGHTQSFNGWFDYIMAFFFYIPNLIIVEIFIRKGNMLHSSLRKNIASGVLGFATLFLIVGTYFFTTKLWGVMILKWIGIG